MSSSSFFHDINYSSAMVSTTTDPIAATSDYNDSLVRQGDCWEAFKFSTSTLPSYIIFNRTQWPHFGRVPKTTYKPTAIFHYFIELLFKSTSKYGIIYFLHSNYEYGVYHENDFIGAMLKNGKVCHKLNGLIKAGEACSQKEYSDGLWHKAVFSKALENVAVCVDGIDCVYAKAGATRGNTTVRVEPEYRIGGILPSDKLKALRRLGTGKGFSGCITNIAVNGVESGCPEAMVNTENCDK